MKDSYLVWKNDRGVRDAITKENTFYVYKTVIVGRSPRHIQCWRLEILVCKNGKMVQFQEDQTFHRMKDAMEKAEKFFLEFEGMKGDPDQ